MSALYHIAQNDPPKLSSDDWSAEFKDFVAKCLAKQSASRPTAEELLQESFIVRPRPSTTLQELIERTKNAVRALDQANYNRMKLIMSDSETEQHPDENLSPVQQTRMAPERTNGAVPDGNVRDLIDNGVKMLSINSVG